MYQATAFLMVDDNPSDVRLAYEFFKDYKMSNCLRSVRNEAEALRYLRRQDEYRDASAPDIILVSIALLWQDGSLLREAKNDASLRQIPIVVMTASAAEEETLKGDPSVSLYVSKPFNLDCIKQVVHHLDELGFVINIRRDRVN